MSLTGKAIWYIECHLDSELSLDAIAEIAEVSRFHLSRAFAATTGESVGGYARARRLSEAAKALTRGAPDIMGVALDAGYGSHEAFTRAFRQHFGMTPEQVRAQVNGIILKEPLQMDAINVTTKQPLAAPRFAKLDALLLVGLSQRCPRAGDPAIPSLWNNFLPHLGHIDGQIGNVAYGAIYNADDSGEYDYLAGVQVREFPARPAEFTRLRIPPQNYAVFQHRDHVSTIASTWKTIWEHGLRDAGAEAADGPSFERYGEEFDSRTGAGGLEIWVPIKSQK